MIIMKQQYIKPEITEERITEIRTLMENNPDWHRSRLSQEICRLWNWCGPNGQLKDISCRDMLRDLESKGMIALPKPLTKGGGSSNKVVQLRHDITPVECSIKEVMPIRIEVTIEKNSLAAFKSYISQYHYLGYDRSIGENIKYMVYSRNGTPLACVMFGSAAWACRPRDEVIGWTKEIRPQNLPFITGNSRFLIFPWVRIPHLASHILSLVARRISSDWVSKYGHPLYLLETFVEQDRFKGTCYKAGNWMFVGSTTGRGRNSVRGGIPIPVKDIYIYPLVRDFRKKLCKENNEP
ncbi:MAG: DUF4338 domain-containing protein [Bacteroidales bacterium]|nr:DUF4338 domain-containing protein [Bacteroidales bacterium]